MKRILPLLALVFVVIPMKAKGTDLITNVDGRTATTLDGKWNVILDPYENGYYDYRYEPSQEGYFLNVKPKDKSDRVEYDFDRSETLAVPGDWNTQRPELFLYEGTVWYKKSFDYALPSGKRLFVYFGAANYDAKVYLNGEKIGEHEGGFTPFNCEITQKVRTQGNFLIVKVDNKRRRDAVPTVNTDWWNYGGLTRSVELVEVPETFIQDYFIQLKKGSRQQLAGWVQLNGQHLRQKVTIEVPEAGVRKEVQTNDQGLAEFTIDASPVLWSPENPRLYDVTLKSDTDEVTDRIGFRTIETRGTDILLTGSPIVLRGVCIHEEAPLRTGRAFSKEDARTLLTWAKELGCNFVRLAHYPHNEHMVRMADQMGLLVWSEIPVYWTILWGDQGTFQNASRQLTDMIQRDKNRAAVILWSVANETPLSDARLSFLRRLVEKARQLDPTRLLTAAMERHYTDPGTQMIDDPLGQYLDVLGCNEYVGWYDGLPAKIDTISWKTIYDKPLIMSEFGGDALQGYHADKDTRWSEEFQESIYEHQVKMFGRIPFLRGTTPWILMDFRSPRRPLPGIQDFFNRKGLVSERGEKKKAFWVMRRFYEAKGAR
jgi:beta-glucuronidase